MNCPIEGVTVHELTCQSDQRGWLTELFRQDELEPEVYPVMSYVSMTLPGETRGPHEHARQTDLFAFVGPSTFRLYLWDNRLDSPTSGASCRLELGEKRPVVVLVPPGVVHGYKNIGLVDGLVFNAPNRLYAGENKSEPVDEIRYENNPNSPFRIKD